MLNRVFKIIAYFSLFLAWLWCIMAIYYIGLPGEKLPTLAAVFFAVNLPLIVTLIPYKNSALLLAGSLCLAVFIYWQQIQPSHERNWVPSVARLPSVKVQDNLVEIQNIRNFDYQSETEFKVRYYAKTYDLNTLETVDYILSYWDNNKAVAHVMLSFGFSDGDYLVISVETRLQENEIQSSLGGFFKQYELIYILADEQDILRLRTNFRQEEVFLYPTTVDKQKVRELFLIVIDTVNQLAKQAAFYNTMTENCFTSLASKFQKANASENPFDYRRYANGYSDAMLYEKGTIYSTSSFQATKAKHHINQYVTGDESKTDYSLKIRPYLKQN